jgi:hypothetical protein
LKAGHPDGAYYLAGYAVECASRRLDSLKEVDSYRLVHDKLESAGVRLEQTSALMILKTSDPFIRALRGLFSKTASVEGMRLGGQKIGDRFVESAIVYRIR